jgi:segregation and condensation protein A
MRIKAKMLLPRKEIDAQGNEIDPRQELVDKILEYKKYKEVSARMAEMEADRMLMIKRGNIQKELSSIGEEASEGTEVQTITMFKLMKAFERVMQRYHDRFNKPMHTVVRYNYSIEQSKTDLISKAQSERTLSFERVFDNIENRVQAIFIFLSMLELVQGKFLRIMIGEGKNNFIVEYNEAEEGLTDEEHMRLL